jgi:hypothetical protein
MQFVSGAHHPPLGARLCGAPLGSPLGWPLLLHTLELLARPCSRDGVTLLLDCCYTVVTLLLHYCYMVLHCLLRSKDDVTLLLHRCYMYTVLTLLPSGRDGPHLQLPRPCLAEGCGHTQRALRRRPERGILLLPLHVHPLPSFTVFE